jgi:23S rRNA pseudouridine2605 synthase
MLNKPAGVLSTSHDESGRTRVIDLVDSHERVNTVGRLDKSTEGLILITNDGDWANRITHPRYGVSKTYLVRVVGRPSPEILARLRSGIRLAEGVARADEVRVRKAFQNCVDLEIVLREGRNREIRRIMAHVGHKVVMLKRIAIGPIRLGELPSGAFRELTDAELKSVQVSTKETGTRSPGKRSRPHIGSRAKLGRYAAERRSRWSNDRNKPKSGKQPKRAEFNRGELRRNSPRKNARNTKGRRR